jgi:hypothetical protein
MDLCVINFSAAGSPCKTRGDTRHRSRRGELGFLSALSACIWFSLINKRFFIQIPQITKDADADKMDGSQENNGKL